MRDDHLKQIEELKDKATHTEQIDEIISSPAITVRIFISQINFNGRLFLLFSRR